MEKGGREGSLVGVRQENKVRKEKELKARLKRGMKRKVQWRKEKIKGKIGMLKRKSVVEVKGEN